MALTARTQCLFSANAASHGREAALSVGFRVDDSSRDVKKNESSTCCCYMEGFAFIELSFEVCD